MRKSIVCLLVIIAVILSSAVSFATEVRLDSCYDFTGDRYGISNIDTDGEVFVGVCANKKLSVNII